MNNETRITNWINNNLSELSQLEDNKGIDIMHHCGAKCCEASVLYNGACKIKDQFEHETNTDIIFDAFKKAYYDSDNFRKDKDVIILIFEKCTCPMAKQGVDNPFLCNCTVGYSYKIFETLFQKKVKVDLETSILNGQTVCKQRIEILS
ncbi:MAG: DUF6144 family protein [Hyphomicrobiales bacterium]